MLLEEAGFSFITISPDVDERPDADESPATMVTRLAVDKARAVASDVTGRRLVLGADTAVVVDGEAVGKPSSPEDAIAMLLRLGGDRHTVVTGFAVIDSGNIGAEPVVGAEKTLVVMKPIGPGDAAEYVATGEPLDKAGSYGIQGLGGRLVERFVGSYTNVSGLPMEAVVATLARLGVTPGRQERPG